MRRLIASLILLALPLVAQRNMPIFHNTYTTSQSFTLSTSAAVLTVQQPAALANTVELLYARIESTVALAFELERDGTAATATATTEVGTTVLTPTAAATAFQGSDVGNGTTIDTILVQLDQAVTVDLSRTGYNVWLVGAGTTKNFSVRSASGTGTVRITICWREW